MKALYFIRIVLGLLISVPVFAQSTYKVGNTEYYYNKTYSTTGKPMVKRSEANKTLFLKSLGYTTTPYGYEIDHIIPLSKGGTDDPSNMQLLTKEQHANKTARERSSRSNYSYDVYPTFKSNSTYKKVNNNSYSLPLHNTKSSSRTIYSGSRGGKYYINRNGNKTYIKSKKKPRSNYSSPSYKTKSSGRTIHTGPRGGRYYINSNGNKTYIK